MSQTLFTSHIWYWGRNIVDKLLLLNVIMTLRLYTATTTLRDRGHTCSKNISSILHNYIYTFAKESIPVNSRFTEVLAILVLCLKF